MSLSTLSSLSTSAANANAATNAASGQGTTQVQQQVSQGSAKKTAGGTRMFSASGVMTIVWGLGLVAVYYGMGKWLKKAG